MRRYLTDKELKETLKKNFTVIVDTNEKVNHHILNYLDSKKIPYISRHLDVGDYSFELNGLTLEDVVSVERKANIDEVAENLTAGRNRFENEFLRAKAKGTKVFLIIENGSWDSIKSHNYISKLNPDALMGSLLSWQAKYNVTINFTPTGQAGELIVKTLQYWARWMLRP